MTVNKPSLHSTHFQLCSKYPSNCNVTNNLLATERNRVQERHFILKQSSQIYEIELNSQKELLDLLFEQGIKDSGINQE